MRISELWRTRVDEQWSRLGTRLAVARNAIVIQWGTPAAPRVVGLSHDGRLAWQSERTGSIDFGVFDDRVFIGGTTVLALDAATGRKIAERDLGTRARAQRRATRSGPVFWLAEQHKLVGLEPSDLSTRWEWDRGFGVEDTFLYRSVENEITTVALDGMTVRRVKGPFGELAGYDAFRDNLYCVMGRRGGGRVAIDIATGEVAWSGREPRWMPRTGFGPASAYSLNDSLEAWDLRTGERRWTRPLEGQVWNTPVEHDGVVYLAGYDERLHAIDAGDGAVISSYPLPEPIAESEYTTCSVVPVSEGRVLVATRQQIVCLEVDSGGSPDARARASRLHVLTTPPVSNATARQESTAPGAAPNTAFCFLVLGGMLLSLARPILRGVSWTTLGHSLALFTTAFIAFSLDGRPVTRVLAILLFLAGWFWSPWVALAGIFLVAGWLVYRGTPTTPSGPPTA